MSRGERLGNLSCREIEVPCPFVVGQPLEDDLRIRCAHDLHDIGLRELLLEPSQCTSKLQGSSRIEALLVAEHLLLLEVHLLTCGCLARRHLRHPSHRFLLERQKRGR